MVFRLQIPDGGVIEYQTVYAAKGEPDPAGDSEGNPHYLQKYCTNCGREWKEKPKDHEECDHLECAIYLAKKRRKEDSVSFFLGIILSPFSLILAEKIMSEKELNPAFIIIFVIAAFVPPLLAFSSLIDGLIAWQDLLDLDEYKGKGTIDGVKAWQIIEEPRNH